MAKTKSGTVIFVGAGPGAPGLMTIRGAELLGRAEVVVHDGLVGPDLLRNLAPTVEVIDAGRRSGEGAGLAPEAVVTLLVDRARAGKRVVRLKGGDPFVFGRGGEEARGVAEAGVRIEVVPGVSSVSAVPAYAGIPVTHRAMASAFTVVTAHEEPGKDGGEVDWAQVARVHGTKVILMGGGWMPSWTAALVAGGMAETTPAAWIESGTTPAQKVVVATLGTLAARVGEQRGTGPGLAVVGEVVRWRERLAWFEGRAWFGRRVVVPRLEGTPETTARRLKELGADVAEATISRVVAPSEREPMIEALAGLGEYDWVIFVSPEGVQTFFDALFRAFDDLRALGNLRIAAIGAATAARVEALRLRADARPKHSTGKAMADAVEEKESIENLRFLVVTGGERDPDLVRELEDRGGIVDEVAFFRRTPSAEDLSAALGRWGERGPEWIVCPGAAEVRELQRCVTLADLASRYPALRWGAGDAEARGALSELGVQAGLVET